MKTAVIETEDKVDELLFVLDRDIQYIQDNLSRLNDLRCLVVRRDDVSLHKLLANIQTESSSYKTNELKRQLLREELAVISGCSLDQMTLSRLEADLSGEKKAEVAQRKTRLQTLTRKFKKEHSSTMSLLSDCARFNSMLVKSVLEFGRTGAITYSRKGYVERQDNTAFVNLQL